MELVFRFQLIKGTPPLINDEETSAFVEKVITSSYPADTFEKIKPSMAGEDFSFYLQQKPGAFIFVGMNSERSNYPHHDPRFDIDEEAIPTAIRLLSELLLHA